MKITGWLATNGGVKDYYYRVNGGEWIKITNCSTTSDANDNIADDVNKQNVGITDYWSKAKWTGHLTTGDLSVDYAGQTVSVEFGFQPCNNPGSDTAPNVETFKEFTNVLVAG